MIIDPLVISSSLISKDMYNLLMYIYYGFLLSLTQNYLPKWTRNSFPSQRASRLTPYSLCSLGKPRTWGFNPIHPIPNSSFISTTQLILPNENLYTCVLPLSSDYQMWKKLSFSICSICKWNKSKRCWLHP
jgi:hypothetical protein